MLLVFYVCLYSAVRSEHPCGNSAILTFKLASACDSLNSAEVIDRRGGICSSLLSWLLSWQTAMQWHIPPKYDGRQKLPAGRRVLNRGKYQIVPRQPSTRVTNESVRTWYSLATKPKDNPSENVGRHHITIVYFEQWAFWFSRVSIDFSFHFGFIWLHKVTTTR